MSKNPDFKKSLLKQVLGIFFLIFLLNYQPQNSPTSINSIIVRAQAEQTQSIQSNSLPLVFQLPHPGYLSTPFSTYHPGIDVATGLGMPVKPIASGKVTESGYNFWGLGLTVVVDHGFGFTSLYAHLGKTYVQQGQTINSSDSIGEVGLTGNTSGPHTHIEITKDGVKINPLIILPEIRKYPQPQDFNHSNPKEPENKTQQTASDSAVVVKKNIKTKILSLPTPSPTVKPNPTPTPQEQKKNKDNSLLNILGMKKTKESSLDLSTLMADAGENNNVFKIDSTGGEITFNLYSFLIPTRSGVSEELVDQTIKNLDLFSKKQDQSVLKNDQKLTVMDKMNVSKILEIRPIVKNESKKLGFLN